MRKFNLAYLLLEFLRAYETDFKGYIVDYVSREDTNRAYNMLIKFLEEKAGVKYDWKNNQRQKRHL